MNLALITPPTVPVVTLAEAKRHLRVDHAEDDDLIGGVIAAAGAALDPAGGGWLGRALRPQTWELRLSSFPGCPIVLPYPPLVAADDVVVTYDDADGAEQTVPTSDYRVVGFGGLGPVSVMPAFGLAWPSSRCDAESVRFRFTAGHEIDGDVDTLPAAIKAAALLMIGDLYEYRETVVVGSTASRVPVSTAVEALLSTYRVY